MKIWIDGYEANVSQRLGSSQVAFEIIKNLEKIDSHNDYTILLPDLPQDDMPKERSGFKYKILKPKKLWTRIALPIALYFAREKPDLFFSPTHYIPRFYPVKKIVTIFDLSFLHFPQMFNRRDLWQLKNGTRFSAKKADKIITISQFSKKDIINQYNVSKEKIVVAYPGFEKDIFFPVRDQKEISEAKDKYQISGDYIIYIGTLQPRKNLVRLIEAIARIKDLKLVIVGKSKGLGKEGWMFDEVLQTPQELGIVDRVIFTGFIPSQDVAALLSGSLGFVQPSLWEGFGIPVVEAMACGVPVIVSNVSSLPEVSGKAGLLVDPYSIDQIEQATRTIFSDKKLRQKLIKQSLIQAKKFSWDKMARTVLKEFEKITKIP